MTLILGIFYFWSSEVWHNDLGLVIVMDLEMESKKSELLALLNKECHEYCLIPTSEVQHKREKKQFINGLMTAARVMGISYDDLNDIIEAMPEPKFNSLDEKLTTPTYIRNDM